MNFFLFMVHYFGTEKVVHSCSLLQFWCISINARFCIFLFINEACFKTISSNIPLCFLGVHNLEYNCITISNLQIFFSFIQISLLILVFKNQNQNNIGPIFIFSKYHKSYGLGRQQSFVEGAGWQIQYGKVLIHLFKKYSELA